MRIATIALALLTFSSPALADVTKVTVSNGSRATLTSAYRNENEVRVYANGQSSVHASELMRVAVVRIAEMTKTKGLPRFGVTKVSDCGTMKMYNVSVYSTCRLLARMLPEGEAAKPEGKRKITYFRTDDVLAGQMIPEPASGGTDR